MMTAPRTLAWAARTWLVVLGGVALLLWRWGDDWWPATVLMFAPRWPWALPLLPLLAWALWRQRRQVPVLLAGVLVWALGVQNLNLPWPGTWWPPARTGQLRVVSYNIGGVNTTTPAVLALVDELRPDVMLLQECGGTVKRARAALETLGWQVQEHTGSCLITRFAVAGVVEANHDTFWKLGGNGIGVRYALKSPGLDFTVMNIHPETVREGLEAVLHRGPAGADRLRDVTALRELEHQNLAALAAQVKGPLLVTGDFNLPAQSAIYRRHWGGYVNAFSHAGWGLGGTKATRWHRLRIDHVLAGPGWRVHGAWVGPHVGGDHRPLVAELSWVGPAP